MGTSMRKYPDGTEIPEALPESYKHAYSPNVPAGQMCSTCRYYVKGYCYMWMAPVRNNWWCKSWKEKVK